MPSLLDLFDNTDSRIARRSLELYPLDVLRKEFDLKGDTIEVTEKVVANTTLADIKEDLVRLMGHCKQHIYVYTHKLKRGNLPTTFFGNNVVYKGVVTETADKVDHEYLLRLVFHYYEIIGETAKSRQAVYWWPVRVIVEPGRCQVRIVIMERNLKVAKKVLFDERSIDDDGVILSVRAALGIASDSMPMDLNKGLKALWNSEKIDSSYAAHKTAKSLDTSAMDVGFMIKKDAPDKFKKIMAEPLKKSVFETSENEPFPEQFASDPSDGKIAFRRYCSDGEAVEKLIDHILALNE